MFDIEIYEDERGKSEIREHIIELQNKSDKDSKIKFNKIVVCIRLLKEYGLSLGAPYIKHIENDIWELRPLRDRIFLHILIIINLYY